MMLQCWPILLLCLSASGENIAVCRESGENITLVCSSAGCPSSIDGYTGMYLYREREEVLYYYSAPGSTKISPRRRYTNRIQTNGSLKNHTVTISNLRVNDSGIYSCVYKRFPDGEVRCNVCTLVVREAAPRSRSEEVSCAPTNEKSLLLVLIIIATSIISMLVTMIVILLIIPRVKQWTGSRRRPTNVPQVSNDYVYEVMTQNSLHSVAAAEQSPYEFA